MIRASVVLAGAATHDVPRALYGSFVEHTGISSSSANPPPSMTFVPASRPAATSPTLL
ncbi:MAG: hypothetical protein ACYDGY_08980 [Acidimicrobiales bacterium]